MVCMLMLPQALLLACLWPAFASRRSLDIGEVDERSLSDAGPDPSLCKPGLERLDKVRGQRLVTSGRDALFKAGPSSLGVEDAASWVTFKAVAAAHRTPFSVFEKNDPNAGKAKKQVCSHTESGRPCVFPFKLVAAGRSYDSCTEPDEGGRSWCATEVNAQTRVKKKIAVCECRDVVFGVHYSDIGQGRIGNCYFLAALASVAVQRPDLIESLFPNQRKWTQNIYSFGFWLHGELITVQVDDFLPVKPEAHFRPLFASLGRTGEFWHIIAEKAWAKLHGSYQLTDGGMWAEAAHALTGAPVYTYSTQHMDADELWTVLEEAVQQGLPMGASTPEEEDSDATRLGLGSGHAYSVVNARISQNANVDKLVKVLDPWAENKYNGKVKDMNKESVGDFYMTYKEFTTSFKYLYVTHLYTKYLHATMAVPVRKMHVLEFSVSGKGNFYVSLHWPLKRWLKPCDANENRGFLAVAKVLRKGYGTVVLQDSKYPGASNMFVKVTSGAGKYVALVYQDLPEAPFVQQATVKVYAPEGNKPIKLASSSKIIASTLFYTIVGSTFQGSPCSSVLFPEQGVFKAVPNKRARGLPTYETNGRFAYYNPAERSWHVVKEERRSEIDGDEFSYVSKVGSSDLECIKSHDDAITKLGAVRASGGPCERVQIAGQGHFLLNRKELVSHVPTYKAAVGQKLAYLAPKGDSWLIASEQYLPDIRNGKFYSSHEVSREDLDCMDDSNDATTKFLPTKDGRICQTVFMQQYGLFQHQRSKSVGLLPTFRSYKMRLLYFASRSEMWYVTSESKWEEILEGKHPGYAEFEKKSLTCIGGEEVFKMYAPSKENSPCELISVPGNGLFNLNLETTVGLVPTYWTDDGNLFLYLDPEAEQWLVSGAKHWTEVNAGQLYSKGSFKPEEISCSAGGDDAFAEIAPNRDGAPCSTIFVKRKGITAFFELQKSKKVGKMPTYHAFSGSFAYYVPLVSKWYIAGKDVWAKVVAGEYYSFDSAATNELRCIAGDEALVLFGPIEKDGSKPCERVLVPQRGLFDLRRDQLVGAVPTYWSQSQKHFIYLNAHDDTWMSVGDAKLKAVQSGDLYSNGKFQKGDLTCIGDAVSILKRFGPTTKDQPCELVSFKEEGLFYKKDEKLINAAPTYWSHDGQTFAFLEISEGTWLLAGSSHFGEVVNGVRYKSAEFRKDRKGDMVCGCVDNAKGVAAFKQPPPCNEMGGGGAKPKYSNMGCNAGDHINIVQRHCSKTCGVCDKL